MPNWFSCLSGNNRRSSDHNGNGDGNGNIIMPSSSGQLRRNHNESNNLNNHFTNGYNMQPVYPRPRYAINENFAANFRDSHYPFNYESESSTDSEQNTYRAHVRPISLNRRPLTDVIPNHVLAYGNENSRDYGIMNRSVRSHNGNQNTKPDFRYAKSERNVQEVPDKGSRSSWESNPIIKKESSSETLFSIGIASKRFDGSAKVPSTLV